MGSYIIMKSKYAIWESKDVPNACSLHKLVEVEKLYELVKGVPRAATFPASAAYRMDPDFPHDTMLIDNLINSDMLVVVSQQVKEFLEKRALKKVEYLPVAIFDHKQKIASRDYFLIHPIDPVDCIDLDKSEVEWGIIDEESIDEVNHLVIDETRIDPEREMFRLKHFCDIVLVRWELAEAIDAQGFTGIRWIDINDYPES
jgi:hypothetical protein